jgi:hypothetical protein
MKPSGTHSNASVSSVGCCETLANPVLPHTGHRRVSFHVSAIRLAISELCFCILRHHLKPAQARPTHRGGSGTVQVTSADGSPITYEAARSHKRVFQTRFPTGQIKFGETGAAFLATIRSGIGWDPLSFGTPNAGPAGNTARKTAAEPRPFKPNRSENFL